LQGHFQPKGCFSSSCTYAIEETLSVKLDNTRNRIRFRSRFVLIDRLPWDTCTADCGAVDIGFDIRYADLGNYSVWIGEKRLGALRIPSKLSLDQRICFSSDHPVTVSGPTPTPTGTPTWTPTAGFDYSPLSPLSVPNRHLPTRPFTLSPALAATASPTASTTPTPEPPALSVAPASTFSTSDTGSATVPIEGQGSTPTP
jgi:hypothetical protein